MKRSSKTTAIVDLDWDAIMERFPRRWVAIQIDEPSDDGVKLGSLIASGRNEDSVRLKFREFRATHPGTVTAFFYTGPAKLDYDVILSCQS